MFREEVLPAFSAIGFLEENLQDLYKIISAILRCGNVFFENQADDGQTPPTCLNPDDLGAICELLGIDQSLAGKAVSLKMRKMPTGSVTYTPREGHAARDMLLSVARCVYEQLFHGLVKKLNNKIKPDDKVLSCFFCCVNSKQPFYFTKISWSRDLRLSFR